MIVRDQKFDTGYCYYCRNRFLCDAFCHGNSFELAYIKYTIKRLLLGIVKKIRMK